MNGTLQMDTASTSNTEVKKEPTDQDSKALVVNGLDVEMEDVKPDLEDKKSVIKNEMWGICIPDMDICTVHSTILPKTNWSYISTVEDFNSFIESLNPRGVRESDLREKLISEKDAIIKDFRKFSNDIEPFINVDEKKGSRRPSVHEAVKSEASENISAVYDIALRDQVLELEERIFFGTLGTLKIRDRAAWQAAIQVR